MRSTFEPQSLRRILIHLLKDLARDRDDWLVLLEFKFAQGQVLEADLLVGKQFRDCLIVFFPRFLGVVVINVTEVEVAIDFLINFGGLL